ncbi:type IV secretory system conjugative DNA transfer family protein [Nocardia alni]|uniref:type IV secretory system conjugative DNA transfer family protein n=1 Tax=Nocardia alni TaxID=2815723 RepID=UPI0020B1A950|nr:TraM recognition domain-containing protein [Nocardia alni]
MGTGKALGSLTEYGVRDKAGQLGVDLGYADAPGVSIGIAVADGVPLYGSYADLQLDIWSPQQGKSTCRAIPAIVEAVGPVIATASKRDIVDATRGVREHKGDSRYVFVFDPQGIAGTEEPVSWYWDPLRWVDVRRNGCEIRAAQLAGHFADDGSDAKSDAFFDGEAEDLLANLFLAAAVAQLPLVQVWEWVTSPHNTEPVEILRQVTPYRFNANLDLAASSLAAHYNADLHMVSRVFGTAKKMIGCLKLSTVHPWITPGSDRYEFDELEFLERNGTLYVLSVAGRGSAAPLVNALIGAVLEVAVRSARSAHQHRLRVPLLAVFDDAANVVLGRDLPQRYSYYGSHGIVLMTLLQSWAQGVRCWGHDGMSELWSAASIKVVGGVDDVPLLRDGMVGSADTLGIPELRSLPRGRAVLFASGVPPVLVRTVPWWETQYADEIRKSLERYSPGKRSVIGIEDLILIPAVTDPPPDSVAGSLGRPDEVQPL